MRDLILRQTTKQLLEQAQAAAIEAIGLRGNRAAEAMRRGRRETRLRQERERWDAISRLARRTRFDAVREGDHGMADQSTTSLDASTNESA
jgi:hypothetical protein